MNALLKEIESRQLPPLKSREEMMEILQREVYGFLPENNVSIKAENEKFIDRRLDLGKVFLSSVDFTMQGTGVSHTFTVHKLIHQDQIKRPLIIFINIQSGAPTLYYPVEELSESEFNIVSFCYKEAVSDDNDFENGVASVVFPNGRSDTDCGKIGLWAFTAMRVLDYALSCDSIHTDEKNIAVIGHSRLGKTALYTGMMDERFTFALSNNAGCMGDALSRGNSGNGRENERYDAKPGSRGETIIDIFKNFPYWFNKNFAKYSQSYYGESFDQHYLLASIAPRSVCVCAAQGDYWADQKSEQLCCLAASKQWENMGLKGMENCERYLEANEALLDGNVGFFMTPTKHLLSRHGWHNFMEFMRKNRHN